MKAWQVVRTVVPASAAAAVMMVGVWGLPAGAAAGAPGFTKSAGMSAIGLSAWGDNSGGELGDGTFNESDSPVAVNGVSGVQAISAGYRFNLALVSGGTVDAWGENQFGELGNGNTTDRTVPTPVGGLSGVRAIAAGGGHSLALLSNGTVMAWGDNAFGQLGDGTTIDRSKPVAVKGLSGVTAIAAGQVDSLALLSNGTVMAWGDGRDGQLGNGSLDTSSSVPVAVHGLTGVRAISAGGFFDIALLKNGTVRAWGEGDNGELGNGEMSDQGLPVVVKSLSGVSAISAGEDHSLALLKAGTVAAWGSNNFSQLGVSTGLNSNSDAPVAIHGLSHVTAIAGGGQSSLALLSTGKVESWGDNALGQLGNGTTTDATTPTPVPGLSAVTKIAYGANHGLALGAPSPVAASAPGTPWRVVPTPDPGPATGGAISVNFDSASAASKTDAWAVGTNENGGDALPVAAHWNGLVWRAVAVPAPAGRAGTLSGVLDLGPSDAWAVGRRTDVGTNVSRTLIEHWNGTRWSIFPSPNPDVGATADDQLEGIHGVSASDIWAVGFDTNPPGPLTMLFEHFDGKTWSAVPSPGAAAVANAVTTIAPNDAWAVGANEDLSRTVAAHWNGKAWSIVPTPSPDDGPDPINQLTGVSAVASNDVWASGYEGNVDNNNFQKPYLMHWNGTSWRLVLAPNAGTEGSQLRAITALSATDIWAVGHTAETDGSGLNLTEQFNGRKWHIVPSPDPGAVGPLIDNGLSAVTSPSGSILLALGSQEVLGSCCTQTLGLKTTKG